MDSIEPKYLNSPDTVLFKKRKILFNYHRAKKYVQKHKIPFILVKDARKSLAECMGIIR